MKVSAFANATLGYSIICNLSFSERFLYFLSTLAYYFAVVSFHNFALILCVTATFLICLTGLPFQS